MIKHLFLLSLFIGFCMPMSSSASSKEISDPPLKIPIPPISIPIPGPTNPRPLSLVEDVEAYYYDDLLSVSFNVDLGDANLVVVNTTTGESWSDSVNGVCTTTLALSGDEGYYEIYIYTDYGEYSGTFII